jgi:hypothetical protein
MGMFAGVRNSQNSISMREGCGCWFWPVQKSIEDGIMFWKLFEALDMYVWPARTLIPQSDILWRVRAALASTGVGDINLVMMLLSSFINISVVVGIKRPP